MPIRMQVAPSSGRVNTRAVGLVTYSELEEYLDQEERRRGIGDPELFDATGARTDVTFDQVGALVRRADMLLHREDVGPTAIVADEDICYGMARMYQIMVEDRVSVGVFRDVAGAERWLAKKRPSGK